MTRSSVAAVLAVCVLSLGASAQPYGNNAHPGPMKNFICPAQVSVKFVSNQSHGSSPRQAGLPIREVSSFNLIPANPPL